MRTKIHDIKRVTSNQSLRHFTIYKESGTRFRTIPMSKEEFEREENNTLNDWHQFLKSDDYYKVKQKLCILQI